MVWQVAVDPQMRQQLQHRASSGAMVRQVAVDPQMRLQHLQHLLGLVTPPPPLQQEEVRLRPRRRNLAGILRR